MTLDGLQRPLFLLTVIVATITALLAMYAVHRMLKNKSDPARKIAVAVLLSFGYGLFAMGELTWYLLYDVFKQLPHTSMPDFYWVIGQLCLLAGFLLYSWDAYRERETHGAWIQLGLALIFSIVLYLFLGPLISGKSAGQVFLGFFYPVMSALILVASISIYLFSSERPLLMFVAANAGFLIGDVLYIYYSATGGYGLLGVLSDLLYVAAYGLCGIALMLWRE